jgi:hypothetical protein
MGQLNPIWYILFIPSIIRIFISNYIKAKRSFYEDILLKKTEHNKS